MTQQDINLQLSNAFNLDQTTLPATTQLQDFSNFYALNNFPLQERFKFELAAFCYCVNAFAADVSEFDISTIDLFIASIDAELASGLDLILHSSSFQRAEALWAALDYLLKQAGSGQNIQIDVLNISKQALRSDFQDNQFTDSLLFKTVHTYAYDMPGADPYGFMLLADYFSSSKQDVDLLTSCAKVAKSAHCPVLTAVNCDFFNKSAAAQVGEIKNHTDYLQRPEYVYWQAFRRNPISRYVSLTFPRFLLRLPYGEDNQIDLFAYSEKVEAEATDLLWGNAAFAMAGNMLQSFIRHGWMVNIRGPQAGGKINNLPVPVIKSAGLRLLQPPVEILIPESHELIFAEQGFVPLSYYVGTNFACFFSANSVHLPTCYDDATATANSRANVRLPYLLLCSRLAHYLKVLQREQIGQAADADLLSKKLNRWLQSLVTKMNNPDASIMARFPLRAASAKVSSLDDNPGYFAVALDVVPHFQMEGMAVQLSLVSRLPGKDKQ